MSKYVVYFETTAMLSVEVDADDEDTAIERAWDMTPPGVCAQCGGWGRAWSLDMGEWDVSEELPPHLYGEDR